MLDKVLKNVPMNRVVAIGVGAGVAMGTALFTLTQQPTLPTMTTDWNAATKDYRRYQNMDVVFTDK